MSRARTPRSSRRRAARPNSSPSGPPQCWPKTPHTPWRQRRKLVHTGIPVATSASMAARVSWSRMRVIVSSRMRSGGWSSKVRGSSSMNSRRAGAVDVAVDREGEGDLVLAPGLLDGLAPDLDAEARDVHPVQRREVPGALGLHLGGEAPGVGRDDVAALLDVAAVHVAHDVGVVDERPRAPQRLVAAALGVGQPAPELGGDASVEDHAALGLQQLLDAAIRRRQLAAGDQARPVLQHAHVRHSRSVRRARVASQGVGMPLPEGEGKRKTSGARRRRPLLIHSAAGLAAIGTPQAS